MRHCQYFTVMLWNRCDSVKSTYHGFIITMSWWVHICVKFRCNCPCPCPCLCPGSWQSPFPCACSCPCLKKRAKWLYGVTMTRQRWFCCFSSMVSLKNSIQKKLADLRLTSRIEKISENISQHDSSGPRKIGRICCHVVTVPMPTEVYFIKKTHSASPTTERSAEQEINDI